MISKSKLGIVMAKDRGQTISERCLLSQVSTALFPCNNLFCYFMLFHFMWLLEAWGLFNYVGGGGLLQFFEKCKAVVASMIVLYVVIATVLS